MADAPVVATPTAPAAAPTAAPGAPAAPAAPAPIPEAALAALKAAGIDPGSWEMELIINGATERVPLNVARQFAQKVRASDKRFQEAAQRDARFAKIGDEVKQNPDKIWDAFEMLVGNGKADDVALARVEASLKREAERVRETPAQRALREENERLKKAEFERTEGERQKAYQARVEAHKLSQGRALYEAVEKTALPHSDATALRIVSIMERAMEQGLEYAPETLAKIAEQEVREEVEAILQAQKDIGRRRKLVGEDLLQAILRGDVETATTAPGLPTEEVDEQPTRRMDDDGSTVVRFKPKGAKKSKPEAQAIRELTRALKSGAIPKVP
jgi:hypothetical protein